LSTLRLAGREVLGQPNELSSAEKKKVFILNLPRNRKKINSKVIAVNLFKLKLNFIYIQINELLKEHKTNTVFRIKLGGHNTN